MLISPKSSRLVVCHKFVNFVLQARMTPFTPTRFESLCECRTVMACCPWCPPDNCPTLSWPSARTARAWPPTAVPTCWTTVRSVPHVAGGLVFFVLLFLIGCLWGYILLSLFAVVVCVCVCGFFFFFFGGGGSTLTTHTCLLSVGGGVFFVFWGVHFFTLYELLLLVVFVDLFWGEFGCFLCFYFCACVADEDLVVICCCCF